MGFPLYLAVTAGEMSAGRKLPAHIAWMSCRFSAHNAALTNLPQQLPEGSMLILDDHTPCCGHDPDLITAQLKEAMTQLRIDAVLLDFQRERTKELAAMAERIVHALPCPVGVPPEYAQDLDCPVFLPPSPLHIPMAKTLQPWKGREIWQEIALCQETAIVTGDGCRFDPVFPPAEISDGFWDDALGCQYQIRLLDERAEFTLFDTEDSFPRKIQQMQQLGISRGIGLYQQLGKIMPPEA